ncbi:hypothetical protein [Archaeoglobus neptunius]|uniref:hypothetical protein n=1 Tax=Archaeoglobus neptunius TaxID=2798580 RepID=UPI0019280D0A|nr:hypothetical protein [Archaeoglobus neptunius]
MFEVKVESEDGVCKIKLFPSDPELEIGGYGRDDILVFKGAPVSISALEKMLEREFGNTIITLKGGSVEVEVQRTDCMLLIEEVADAIREMMENAARDLDEIEDAIKRSLEKFVRRSVGRNGD